MGFFSSSFKRRRGKAPSGAAGLGVQLGRALRRGTSHTTIGKSTRRRGQAPSGAAGAGIKLARLLRGGR